MIGIIFTDVNGSLGVGRYAGPYRVASEFRKRGQEVKVVDFMMRFSLAELKMIVAQYITPETQWIGISSTFLASANFDPFLNRIQIRDHLQKSTSVGLTHEEAEDFFKFCREKNLRILIGGSRQKFEFDNVEWVSGNAEEKLFSEPFAFNDSKILWNDDDHISEGEHLPIEIARGCIFKCSFCSYNLNGKKLWEFCKTPEVVEEEMMRNYDKFGTTGYMFSDDTYNDSPIKVSAFNDMFKQLPFDIEFTTYARLDLILSKWETMDMLAESGMKAVFFGVESFNHASAKSIGKGMDPERIKDGLLRIKHEYPDILLCTGFIAGLPHETIDTLETTIDWLESSPIDSYSYQVLSMGSSRSDMSLNPAKYGYKFDNDGHWFNDHMSYHDAITIAERAKKSTLTAFTFYSRLRNLGYTPQEVRSLTEDDRINIQERTTGAFNSYKSLIIGE